MPTFYDLGTKPKPPTESPAQPAAPKTTYPSIYGLTTEQLPDLALYEVGDEIELIVKAKVRGKTARDPETSDAKGAEAKDAVETFELDLEQAACVHHGDHKTASETGQSVKDIKARKEKS